MRRPDSPKGWADKMLTSVNRAAFGFVAHVISLLTFHQSMWGLLHLIGLMLPPYPTKGVPALCFASTYQLCTPWDASWQHIPSRFAQSPTTATPSSGVRCLPRV